MKIALSGCSGAGKTTLATGISTTYNIPLIPEFARETLQEMGLKSLRNLDSSTSFLFQTKILEKKIEEESKHKSYISDRSYADNLAYYLRWCCREMEEMKNKNYYDKCIENLKKYDLVIVLPWMGIPYKKDGIRSTNIYYTYEMYTMTLGILCDQNINYEFINETSITERIQYFKKYYENNK